MATKDQVIEVLKELGNLFRPRYMVHLEEEVAYLRKQNAELITRVEVLHLKLEPKQEVKREIPKLTPIISGWDQYLEREMAQQLEESSPENPAIKE